MVKAIGFPDFTGMDDEESEIYDRVKHGRCMTCNGVMGEHANFIVTTHGIVGGYCSGQCHSDMAVLGFLQEQYDDLTSAISFRGAGHKQVDVPDSPGNDAALDDHVGEDES